MKSQSFFQKIDWPVTLFLIITPLATLILTPLYFVFAGFSLKLLLFALVFAAATNLSITAGYHRLFAHRSYEAHPLVRALFLLIGASAWQGTALKWSADHRRHHAKVDSDEDPYSIKKGFWYAHMGWLFLKETRDDNPRALDLERDWMVRFQHKYYIPLAIFMGFGVPTLIGWGLGCPWGGFVIAGCLRIVLTQQSTFFVNSLCHTLGKQTYSEISARDSVIVAVLTHGEGYHNFHHQFQADYRNGIRWYQWDPTKWTIQTLAAMGLAQKLRRVPSQEILRARLQMEAKKMKMKGFSEEKIHQLKEQILAAQMKLKQLSDDYKKARSERKLASQQKIENFKLEYHRRLDEIKAELAQAKREAALALELWQTYLQAPANA